MKRIEQKERMLSSSSSKRADRSAGGLEYWSFELVDLKPWRLAVPALRVVSDLHLYAGTKIERQESLANRVFCGLSLELLARTVINTETVLPKAARAAGKILPRLNLGVVSVASPRGAATISLERRVVSKQ
jgi:hypothetical protein